MVCFLAVELLTRVLPGFRELRASVIAGYIWMVCGWIAVDPNLDVRPDSGPVASLYDLAERTGPITIAIAASVLAYIVGAASQDVLGRIVTRIRRRSWRRRGAWHKIIDSYETFPSGIGPLDRLLERLRRAEGRAKGPGFDDSVVSKWRRAYTLYDKARDQLLQQLELPPTLLVGEHQMLFDQVDRVRGEGEFRQAVVPPLLAVVGLLGVGASAWWCLAVAPLCFLFREGYQRETESRLLIAEAVDAGIVRSAALDAFREAVVELEQATEAL
jgi:hypothetical protein